MANCPRCKVMLQSETYEGFDTLFCSNCWGHFMSNKVFTAVLQHDGYTFDAEERKSVFSQLAAKGEHDLISDGVVSCPICEKEMEKKPFSDACPVILDLCHDHGVWLDSVEIKQVQVYFDSLQD